MRLIRSFLFLISGKFLFGRAWRMYAVFLSGCLGAYSLPAQGQFTAQDHFELKGKVDGLTNGDKIYLVYQVDDQQRTDSAVVANTQFLFKGKLDFPVYASLFLNRNPYINRLGPGQTMDFFRFYLEPSAFRVESKDSLKNSLIKGSPVNDLHSVLRAMLKLNDDHFEALRKEFEALPQEQQKDKKVYDSFVGREQQLLNESFQIHLAFAKKYPQSYLSVISLAHIAAHPEVTEGAAKAYQALPEKWKNSPIGKTIPVLLEAPLNTQIGRQAPDFEQPSAAGKPTRLSDFRGSYVLLDFWASWCGPCRAENPNVAKAFDKYKEKGFTVLGVSLDMPGQKDAWLKAIKEDGLTWPQVADLRGWENTAAKRYGIRSVPANFLIDPTGKIIAVNLREEKLQQELARIFPDK